MSFVVEAQLDLPAPPERVFEAMCDHTRWPEWMPPTFAPLGPTVGRLTIGAKFKARVDRMPFPSLCEITHFVRPHELTWSGGIGALLKAEHRFFFDPHEGGTRVRSSEIWSGPLAAVASPFIKWRAKVVAGHQLAGLAKALG